MYEASKRLFANEKCEVMLKDNSGKIILKPIEIASNIASFFEKAYNKETLFLSSSGSQLKPLSNNITVREVTNAIKS